MRMVFNPLSGQFDYRGITDQGSDSVPMLSSAVVETLSLSDFVGVEYGFQLDNGTDAKTFKLLVTNDNGTLKDTIFAKSGSLSAGVDVTIQGGNMEIEVSNNTAAQIDLTFTRVIL